jgi:Tfp pilus assembly protein PilO
MFGDKKELRGFWVTIGAVVILVAITTWVGFDLYQLALTVQQERQERAERVAAAHALATLQSDALRAQAYRSTLENILPTKDTLIQFPKEIVALGKEGGEDVGVTFRTETASTEKTPGSIQFAMTVDGSYDEIAAFISRVERSRYIVAWDTIDVSEQKGRYRATIDGRVFSR